MTSASACALDHRPRKALAADPRELDEPPQAGDGALAVQGCEQIGRNGETSLEFLREPRPLGIFARLMKCHDKLRRGYRIAHAGTGHPGNRAVNRNRPALPLPGNPGNPPAKVRHVIPPARWAIQRT